MSANQNFHCNSTALIQMTMGMRNNIPMKLWHFIGLHYFQQFFTANFITFSLILSSSASNVQRTQLSCLRAVRDTFYVLKGVSLCVSDELACKILITDHQDQPSSTTDYQAVPLTTKQYHTLPGSTTDYQAVPHTTKQYHTLPCTTIDIARESILPIIAIILYSMHGASNVDIWCT